MGAWQFSCILKAIYAFRRSCDLSNIILLVYCRTLHGKKWLVLLYLTGRKIPLGLTVRFFFTHPRSGAGFLASTYMLYHCFIPMAWYTQSLCVQWICSLRLFLHVFKRCHLVSIPFDAQLLQRTWQKSRILVVKSHEENPRWWPPTGQFVQVDDMQWPFFDVSLRKFKFCKEIHEYVSVPTWLLNPKSLSSQDSFPFNSEPRVGTAPCSNNFDVGSCSCSSLWHDNFKAYTTFAKLMKFHGLVVVCDTILYATGLDVTDYDRNLNCMKLLHG